MFKFFSKDKNFRIYLPLLFCLIFITYLFFPFVNYGLPYFYDEDEGHHFDRVVEMVKEGRFNPQYFHKPSLHFYLRMPVTAWAFLHIAKKGEISSIQELKTTDKFSLAGRSFTTSHIFIAKANRLFSLGLTLMSFALVFFLSLHFINSVYLASFVTILSACSETMATRSAFIGVDGPMMLFALLTVFLSIKLQKKFSYPLLILSALSAGFTISTKYNAAPIILTPFLALILSETKKTPLKISLSLFLPIVGFLITSPFILFSLPLFLDELAYEAWHYKTGHIGHMAEPGLAQALFYLRWLLNEGWHVIPLLAITGLFFILNNIKTRYIALIFICFPLCYLGLMLMQRVNFTRNMLVIIPFIAILAGVFLEKIKLKKSYSFLSLYLLPFCILFSPFYNTLQIRQTTLNNTDTRDAAYQWLLENQLSSQQETAIVGIIGLKNFISTTNRVKSINYQGITRIPVPKTLYDLYLDGFDRVVVGPETKLDELDLKITELEQIFVGSNEEKRVYQNPTIRIYRFKNNSDSIILSYLEAKHKKQVLNKHVILTNLENNFQEYWLSKRVFLLKLTSKINKLTLFNPWQEQLFTISALNGSAKKSLALKQGEQAELVLDYKQQEQKREENLYIVKVKEVHSPQSVNGSSDNRRLGILLKVEK